MLTTASVKNAVTVRMSDIRLHLSLNSAADLCRSSWSETGAVARDPSHPREELIAPSY
jgi:hypothetical protein